MATAISTIPRWSSCAIRLYERPYLFGYVDGFLPIDTYRNLDDSFVDPTEHPQGEVLGKGKRRIMFRSPPTPEFLTRSGGLWAEAVEEIASADFMGDCWRWFGANVERMPQPEGPYRELLTERLKVDPSHLRMQCEFSVLESGVLLPPHSDSTDKVISFILYMPPAGWKAEWGGGTDIYEPLDARRRFNWCNAFLPASDMRTEYSCPYVPNRLFFFVKGYNAWHGVSPILAPPGIQRRSFNFSLQIPAEAVAGTRLAKIEAEIKRSESRLFR
jgi:hypothetical protein